MNNVAGLPAWAFSLAMRSQAIGYLRLLIVAVLQPKPIRSGRPESHSKPDGKGHGYRTFPCYKIRELLG